MKKYLLILFLLITACGSGASSSGSSLQPLPQANQDLAVGTNLRGGTVGLYNVNNIASTNGAVSFSGNCPNGGTVSITGTDYTTVTSTLNSETLNLTFQFIGCRFTSTPFTTISTADITYTGTLVLNGTKSNPPSSATATTVNLSYTSSNMQMTGTITGSNFSTTNISESGGISINESLSNGTLLLSGTIAGRPFSL